MYEEGNLISEQTDEDMEDYVKEIPQRWVRVHGHGWVDVDFVKFVDISEDLFGNDVLTFEYKDRIYHSNIHIGDKP
jgi:hypothetical protein